MCPFLLAISLVYICTYPKLLINSLLFRHSLYALLCLKIGFDHFIVSRTSYLDHSQIIYLTTRGEWKTRRYRGETSKTERNDFFFIIPMTYGMKPLWLSGLRYKGRKTGGFTWKSEIIFSLVARSLARTTRSAQATACAVDRIGGYYDVNATKMRRVATFVTRKTQWVNDILDDATPRSRKS